MPLALKELGEAVYRTRDVIAKKPTAELKADLAKMKKWRDTASDRLEKMAFGDLVSFMEEELRKRKTKT